MNAHSTSSHQDADHSDLAHDDCRRPWSVPRLRWLESNMHTHLKFDACSETAQGALVPTYCS